MNRKKSSLIAAAALSAAMAGCVSIGHSFDTSKVSSITLGKTTQAQIQQIFGTPTRTGTEDGNPTWTFLDYKIGVLGLQRANDLYVKFNPDGTVKSYSFNTDQ